MGFKKPLHQNDLCCFLRMEIPGTPPQFLNGIFGSKVEESAFFIRTPGKVKNYSGSDRRKKPRYCHSLAESTCQTSIAFTRATEIICTSGSICTSKT